MLINKILLLSVLTLITPAAFSAVKVGKEVPPLKLREVVNGYTASFSPIALESGEKRSENFKSLTGLIFFGTWSQSADVTMPALAELQSEFQNRGLRLIAISPEKKAAVKAFLKRHPEINFAVGVDKDEETLKNYFGIDVTLPTCLLVDDDEKIIWIGDIVDLPVVVRSVYRGKFDMVQQKAVTQLTAQMRSALRAGKNTSALELARQINKRDPGNPAAMRLVLFILESGGQFQQALDYLEQTCKSVPDSVDATFAFLQFLQRHPEYEKNIVPVAERAFTAFKKNPRDLNNLAWLLMDLFPFVPGTLSVTGQAIAVAEKELPSGAPNVLKASLLVTTARYLYKCGQLEKAVVSQTAAVELLGSSRRSLAMAKLLKYYQQALAESENSSKP